MVNRARSWFPIRLAIAYGQSQAGGYASALAFNAFISMFPLMLGILAILGYVMRSPSAQQQVQATLVGFFPSEARAALVAALNGIRRHPGLLGLISLVGLVYSGTNLFASMEWVLGKVFGTGPRDFFRQRLIGLAMTVVFAVGVGASVLLTAAAGVLRQLPLAGPVLGALVFVVLFGVVYRVVPNRSFRAREIWPGALLGGVGTEVLALFWPFYTRVAHGFNTYGATFALFFLLAAWLYFLSQFILIGAVLNRMLMERGPPSR